MAEDLRPALETALALKAAGNRLPEYSPQASEGGRTRMHQERERMAELDRRPAGVLPWRAAVLGATAGLAALLVLGFATGVLDPGRGPDVAQAQGVVASAGPDTLILSTQQGPLEVRIGESTVVLDSSGNVISGSEIVPGARATIEFEEEEDGNSGVRVEIEAEEEDDGAEDASGTEVEFNGVVQSFDGSTLVLTASFGTATVRVDAQTQVEATLEAGRTVKIHALRETSGLYLAREIQAVGGGDEPAGDGSGEPEGDESGGEGDQSPDSETEYEKPDGQGSESSETQQAGDSLSEEGDH
jgi:hypothetical protein